MLNDPLNHRGPQRPGALMSRWSMESHSFIAVWEKFGPTLEDVFNLMALPLYGEVNTIGLILEEEEEDNL